MSDDDVYMARIRKRAEIEDSGDDYEEEEEENEGGEGGEESEEENEKEDDEAHHQPGQGYDSDSQQEGDYDHAENAREAALATIKSLPLAERLALMASGADTISAKRRTNGNRNKGKSERIPRDEENDDEEEDNAKRKGDKHRPKEVSSKRPVGRFRVVVEPKEGGRKARDPRFDSAVGKMNYTMFRKAYNFLEDYQSNEIQTLKTALKNNKNPTKALEIKSALSKIQQEKSERYRHDRKTQILSTKTKEEKSKVAAGKSPFFLKKREKRRLELEDRYEQLAKQGSLEKALAKKRRKNAAKDHRWLPRTRRGMGGEE